MTNEQAIEIFKERLDLAERYGYAVELGGYDDAMRMAIEALRQMTEPKWAEPFTDAEKRIFLSAMARERKVCRKLYGNYTEEMEGTSLIKTCNEIERKVKDVLWMN